MLSISRQCALLGLPRSTLYYQPMPVHVSTLRSMARIDALYLEDPCSGSCRTVDYLAREGIPISRDLVRNLMRRMGLRAIFQKPRRISGDPSERFPCLADLRVVTAVYQVWAAVVDLFSREVLSWQLSNSLDIEYCLDTMEIAMGGGRRPKIFYSDQGWQFTSADFVGRLQGDGIKISWYRKKRCYDNIELERLWRRVKYEEVYLHAYSDGWEAELSLARFLWRYCHVRPQNTLGGSTLHDVYTEIKSCSSRPELTMLGAETVHQKAPTSQFTGGAAAKQLRHFRGDSVGDGRGLITGRW